MTNATEANAAERMAQINRPAELAAGVVALELLVTDHVAYVVTAVTPATIRLRRCSYGAPEGASPIRDPFVDQGQFPVIWEPIDTRPNDQEERTVRRRADGTYRMHRTGHPLRFVEAASAHRRIDYRF